MAFSRKDERVASIMNAEWTGQDFDPCDPNQITAPRLNTYLVDCLEKYEVGDYLDDILFDNLKDDFAEWTEEHFKVTDRTLRTTVKNYLKDHGVFVGDGATVSKQLVSTIKNDKYSKWPEEEAEKYRQIRGKKFRSVRNNPGFDKPDIVPNSEQAAPVKKSRELGKPSITTRTSALKRPDKKDTELSKRAAATPDDNHGDCSDSSSDDGSNDRRNHDDNDGGGNPGDDEQESPIKEISRSIKNASITPAPAFPTTTSKALTDLGKLYDNNKKFGGDLYDILDSKIKIFRISSSAIPAPISRRQSSATTPVSWPSTFTRFLLKPTTPSASSNV